MTERRRPSYIRQIRLNAMLSAADDGVVNSDALKKAADIAEAKLAIKIGRTSEGVFDDKIWAYFAWVLADVRKSTPQEDHNKIDRWLIFQEEGDIKHFFPNLRGKIIPAQIKSNRKSVENFKNSPEFKTSFHKKIVVLWVRQNISKKDFKKQMMHELSRVNNLIGEEKA